ncbi:hypothetical protein OO015_13680 (plasmid) [Thermomicrobium sp. 4228-Ro]|uniref:hypothetical protein n=1 Tax=Thermomicrobium sp. 4228-Ro TaxID=2993937 RepID=UPI002248BB04|nr:hypothetical protein [Thermomicrobium sp. 4228-Ro]MCX2728535.1 hypothetical protein [Thermomicrobium sp. 4228-Ro]
MTSPEQLNSDECAILLELEGIAERATQLRRAWDEGEFEAGLLLLALVRSWLFWRQRSLQSERSEAFHRRLQRASVTFTSALLGHRTEGGEW